MLLSAALIVRDEERQLDACLSSLRGAVDEIVVVDTGSSDRSPEMAAAHGARLARFEWRSDFAAARNASLDLARGRWILYIDADETLAAPPAAELRGFLEGARELAFRVLLRPAAGWTPYREYRVWRNDPRIRFRGLMHEKVMPAIRSVADSDGLAIGDCDVLLEHTGYAADQERKHRRNLPLLEAQLERDPSDVFSWRHLGKVHAELGDAERAERALLRAIELARAGAEDAPHGSLAFAELARLRHAQGRDMDDLVHEGLERYPGNWLLVWIRARLDLERGELERALAGFDRLLAVDRAALPDRGVAYDERIFGAFAHASRGLCLLRLGRSAEAASAYAAAKRAEPPARGQRVRRRLAEYPAAGR